MSAKKPMADEKTSTFAVSTGEKKSPPASAEYVDKLPEGKTYDDIKAERGIIVWCKYAACKSNQQVEGLQRTTGTIRKNPSYKPIGESEHIWKGICTRNEIAIDFTSVRTVSGVKQNVPSCFVSSVDTRQHQDWSKMLQNDGTPYGGSTESRTFEHDWDKHGNWDNGG
jgi:hypothetical protein|tara:strand:- start:7897 stop:8400 length:504 start_codon:yes stop_codon:yes gene_type:complete